MKRNKKSNSILDLESIRLLGRCILGDKNGNLLSVGGNVPNTLNLWLKANAGNNPFEEYSIWSNIMNCIGERKFIKKSINKDELYKITQNAYKEVKSEYSIDNGARQVIDVINDIVNQ